MSLILNTIVRINPAIDASAPRTVHMSIRLLDNDLSRDFSYDDLLSGARMIHPVKGEPLTVLVVPSFIVTEHMFEVNDFAMIIIPK